MLWRWDKNDEWLRDDDKDDDDNDNDNGSCNENDSDNGCMVKLIERMIDYDTYDSGDVKDWGMIIWILMREKQIDCDTSNARDVSQRISLSNIGMRWWIVMKMKLMRMWLVMIMIMIVAYEVEKW